ncbi:MAG: DUF6431 domain-containing protein [Peptococcaceae bacterium]|nr:DUF6431 domain-containing protein [Peptococcaceae bacterium]
MRTLKKGFFVRSGEQISCPCCNGPLKVCGSRRRKYVNGTGDTIVLVIRRLRCRNCGRLHHELPDILVPYKRYGSKHGDGSFVWPNNGTVPMHFVPMHFMHFYFDQQPGGFHKTSLFMLLFL